MRRILRLTNYKYAGRKFTVSKVYLKSGDIWTDDTVLTNGGKKENK